MVLFLFSQPSKERPCQPVVAEGFGGKMVLNIIMLGFVTALSDALSAPAVRKAVAESVPRGTQKLNEDAFDRGHADGLSLKDGEKK